MTSLPTIAWRSLCFCLCFCSAFAFIIPLTAQDGNADLDQDGLIDRWEMMVFGTDPDKSDTDKDGHLDGEETRNGWDPLGKDRLKELDYDQDRLTNRLELLFGSDPMQPDTDKDGHLDGAEVFAAFSPTSTEQTPLQKSLRINVKTQRIEKLVNGIAIEFFPISSGKASTPTPLGEFKVLNKSPKAWSRMAGLWMPYWMGFTGRGHGIHELPIWPSGYREGSNHLGRPVSHGCVRLGIGTAENLYDWTPVGTVVQVVRR
jgi:hypothetical protein